MLVEWEYEINAREDARWEEYLAYCDAQDIEPDPELMEEHMSEFKNNKLIHQDYISSVV